MRIAVDAMGGDFAPTEIIKGAIEAADKFPDIATILVGDQGRIEQELSGNGWNGQNITIQHASQVVSMNDSVVEAVRKKPDSSIKKCATLVGQGEADALLSAGNTGAAVAASTLSMKLLSSVKRPGIAVTLPTLTGKCVVIDVGANIKCKPIHLLQYGVMASIYSRDILGVQNPIVGLLSIGEEDRKGNDLVKQSHTLLAGSSLNFVGNVEGRDIFNGKCDVVVCEGFVGNVILKVSEGLSESLLHILKQEVKSHILSKIGAVLCKPALKGLKTRIDYAEYGGAPLLGVEGICTICHGRSDARAVQNAIRFAREFALCNVNKHIVDSLANN